MEKSASVKNKFVVKQGPRMTDKKNTKDNNKSLGVGSLGGGGLTKSN